MLTSFLGVGINAPDSFVPGSAREGLARNSPGQRAGSGSQSGLPTPARLREQHTHGAAVQATTRHLRLP